MKHQTMFDYFDSHDFDLGINKTTMSEVASTEMAPQRQQQQQTKSFLTNKENKDQQKVDDESEETKISENTEQQDDEQLKKEEDDAQNDKAEGMTKEISNLKISELKEEKSDGELTNSGESS